MEEYTYKDVVTIKDIMSGEVDDESLEGKWGWTGDSIEDVLRYANNDFISNMIEMVDTENLHSDHPFFDGRDYWSYFIQDRDQGRHESCGDEESYLVGDIVRLKSSGNLGVCLSNSLCDSDSFVVVKLDDMNLQSAHARDLEHAKAHFDPFDFSSKDVRRSLIGRVVEYDMNPGNCRDKVECMVTGFVVGTNGADGSQKACAICGYSTFSADEFLEECRFIDETPCGQIVEDKED